MVEKRLRGEKIVLDNGVEVTYLNHMFGEAGAKFVRIVNERGRIEVISARRVKEENEDQNRTS